MASKAALSALVPLLLVTLVLGSPLDNANPFLVGGNPAPAGAFPAQVGIQIGATRFCGGTILNQNHILTAAGCVLDANNHLVAPNTLTVRAGALILNENAPLLAVQRIFPHQQYNPWTFENDIAVLRLTNNILFPVQINPNLAPAVLYQRIVPERAQCQVVGWNWQPAAQNLPLQMLNVEYASNVACNQYHVLRDSMACTQLTQQTHGLCEPNRGGGVYYNSQLTGVLSFGFGCTANQTMTVFTQVRYYNQWIQQQFVRTDTPPAGPTPAPGVVGGQGGGATSIALSLVTVLVAIVSTLCLV
ncbi:chymotrypsin-1-like [Anopheles nili]|uniref:chymotrypsin-1-like n=1 Tax=Anopheles nili TaxID=185578 RepID=UPI00237B28D6|nr:chymotrypsin-1-like [Anopheles nili]